MVASVKLFPGGKRWCPQGRVTVLVIFVQKVVLCKMIVTSAQLVNGQRLNRLSPNRLIITVLVSGVTALYVRSISLPLLCKLIPVLALIDVSMVMDYVYLGSEGLEGTMSNSPGIVVSGKGVSRSVLRRLHCSIRSMLTTLQTRKVFSVSRIRCTVIRAAKDMDMLRGRRCRPLSERKMVDPGGSDSPPGTMVVSKRVVSEGATTRLSLETRKIFVYAISRGKGTRIIGGTSGGMWAVGG